MLFQGALHSKLHDMEIAVNAQSEDLDGTKAQLREMQSSLEAGVQETANAGTQVSDLQATGDARAERVTVQLLVKHLIWLHQKCAFLNAVHHSMGTVGKPFHHNHPLFWRTYDQDVQDLESAAQSQAAADVQFNGTQSASEQHTSELRDGLDRQLAELRSSLSGRLDQLQDAAGAETAQLRSELGDLEARIRCSGGTADDSPHQVAARAGEVQQHLTAALQQMEQLSASHQQVKASVSQYLNSGTLEDSTQKVCMVGVVNSGCVGIAAAL